MLCAMSKTASRLLVTDAQQAILEGIASSSVAQHRLVLRARVLLLAAAGVSNSEIARVVEVSRPTVLVWRGQLESDGLKDFGKVAQGRGRKPSILDAKVAEIVDLTQHSKPRDATHWSCRSMADEAGVSSATVQRIWSARGIKPHLVKTFKISSDPRFEDKLVDVVGLYLTPPGPGRGAVHGREDPDPGAGPHPALAAAQTRPGRHHDPRLQAQRRPPHRLASNRGGEAG